MFTTISIIGIIFLCLAGVIALGAAVMLSVQIVRGVVFLLNHLFTFQIAD